VQVEQLRARLNAFAKQQAEWYEQGWRIEHTELSGDKAGATLDVDGEPIHLTGRIDRIDRHAESGAHAVLDYKSSDKGEGPEKTHRRSRQWVDLQLPLYRHLARGFVSAGPVQLGFVLLPKDVSQTRFEIADWTESQLNEADDVARDVVRAIRQQVFWPPQDPRARFDDPFAPICQVGVLGRELGVGS
jgi:RecB family exonuclease